jgi:hypothetical protein
MAGRFGDQPPCDFGLDFKSDHGRSISVFSTQFGHFLISASLFSRIVAKS